MVFENPKTVKKYHGNPSYKLEKDDSDSDQLLLGLDRNLRLSQNAEKNEARCWKKNKTML